MIKKKEFKILVVDDSDIVRNSIVSILEEAGHKVAGSAKSAEEAVKIAHQTHPVLCLIDLVMPEISGFELAKALNDQFQGLYMIMMSSLKLEHLVIDSISNGAIDFLEKPFDKKHLLNAVEKVQIEFQRD